MASRRNSTSPKPIDTGNPHASPLLIHLAQEHQVELRRAAEAYRRRLPSGSAHADVPSRRAWHRSRQRLGALLTPSDCLENPMILSSAFLQVLTAPMITEVTDPVDGGPAGPLPCHDRRRATGQSLQRPEDTPPRCSSSGHGRSSRASRPSACWSS
ncbi:MAG: hypothetical protein ACXV3A_04120, partial [Kineosporiaceae bacterium]